MLLLMVARAYVKRDGGGEEKPRDIYRRYEDGIEWRMMEHTRLTSGIRICMTKTQLYYK